MYQRQFLNYDNQIMIILVSQHDWSAENKQWNRSKVTLLQATEVHWMNVFVVKDAEIWIKDATLEF